MYICNIYSIAKVISHHIIRDGCVRILICHVIMYSPDAEGDAGSPPPPCCPTEEEDLAITSAAVSTFFFFGTSDDVLLLDIFITIIFRLTSVVA